MMKKEIRSRARKRLDERLMALGPVERFAVPPRGWIRAIRDALGMSGPQLGQRIGITAQSVHNLEASEVQGTVQLNTLRKAAEAMDCMLVYALVPKTSLEAAVDNRERALAIDALRRVSHSMALEDQRVADTENEARIQRNIAANLRQRASSSPMTLRHSIQGNAKAYCKAGLPPAPTSMRPNRPISTPAWVGHSAGGPTS